MLIIDGYNLLFHSYWEAQGDSLEDQRRHLISQLGKYKRRFRPKKLIVVFDGRSYLGPYNRPMYQEGIEVIYATSPGRADEEIISLSREFCRATVVTADRKLSNKVKKNQSIVISPENFIRQWKKSSDSQQEMEDKSPERNVNNEIEYWLDAFKLQEEIEIPKRLKRQC